MCTLGKSSSNEIYSQLRKSIFNINEKRKTSQSSVTPKFWTMYRTLVCTIKTSKHVTD